MSGGPRGEARRARIKRARLYLCAPVVPDLGGFLDEVLGAGVDVFQLRDKEASDDALLAAASIARRVCTANDALFIFNDRPDLAVASGADGVHLGQDDGDAGEARSLVGPDLLIGRSTHSVAEIERALEEPVDYLGVGPVNETPTKPGRPGTGLGLVRDARRVCGLPFFVTGGMDRDTVGGAVQAGAHGVVVVRAIVGAPDPSAATREIRRALDGSFAGHAR